MAQSQQDSVVYVLFYGWYKQVGSKQVATLQGMLLKMFKKNSNDQ